MCNPMGSASDAFRLSSTVHPRVEPGEALPLTSPSALPSCEQRDSRTGVPWTGTGHMIASGQKQTLKVVSEMCEISAIPNAQDLARLSAADLLTSREGHAGQAASRTEGADALGVEGPAPPAPVGAARGSGGEGTCARPAPPALACAAGRGVGLREEGGAPRAATWPRRNARARGRGAAGNGQTLQPMGSCQGPGWPITGWGWGCPSVGGAGAHPWAADAGLGEGRSEGRGSVTGGVSAGPVGGEGGRAGVQVG